MARLADLVADGTARYLHALGLREGAVDAEGKTTDERALARVSKVGEAMIEDHDDPDRAADFTRLTLPETVARKALGEFDVDEGDAGLADLAEQIVHGTGTSSPDCTCRWREVGQPCPVHAFADAGLPGPDTAASCAHCGGKLIRCCDFGQCCSSCGKAGPHG